MKSLSALKYTLYSLILIFAIFCGATFMWMFLKGYELEVGQFKAIMCLILKNAGSYSVLLVGVVITICFQVYSKEREIEKENQVKIKEVGYYTLAFKLKDDKYEEDFVDEKVVIVIKGERDYSFEHKNFDFFMIKFLTSKKESTNLKNIMAFEDEYFERNKKNILGKYYTFCEKVNYMTPLYCSTKPTSELYSCSRADKNRYFWLGIRNIDNTIGEEVIKYFWVSGLTEEGILLFIKVKAKLQIVERGTHISLLQQTTYYKNNNELCPLYGDR